MLLCQKFCNAILSFVIKKKRNKKKCMHYKCAKQRRVLNDLLQTYPIFFMEALKMMRAQDSYFPFPNWVLNLE